MPCIWWFLCYQFSLTVISANPIPQGLEKLGDEINTKLAGNEPMLVLHFDCAGRGKMMFREAEKLDLLEELELALEDSKGENSILSSQVLRLVKTESELYSVQEQIDTQISIYHKLF